MEAIVVLTMLMIASLQWQIICLRKSLAIQRDIIRKMVEAINGEPLRQQEDNP
jgi:hypothetical protein